MLPAPHGWLATCGEGTVWDPINEECIIAVPTDNDFDGCVTPSDLLNLLATFGTCPPYPEWPDEPTDTTWTCGDPVTYWDYDYATVLIGDQCWFAENLQSTSYSDGTEIPEVIADDEWAELTTGARCSYANDASNVAVYGRLYNWFAVNSSHGLCPAGWGVPTHPDWYAFEDILGSQGFLGMEATALKAETGWCCNGNGTDDFGFTALPGGERQANGTFLQAGNLSRWWSSSDAGSFNGGTEAWRRYLRYDNPDIKLSTANKNIGFSIRCIRD